MKGKSILGVLKKYSVVIVFPTLAASFIYADWSHTRKWKASKIQQLKAAELTQ